MALADEAVGRKAGRRRQIARIWYWLNMIALLVTGALLPLFTSSERAARRRAALSPGLDAPDPAAKP